MELSTKFDAKAIESQVKEYIKSIDLEKQIFASDKPEKIRFIEGPPTMNGIPHAGHLRGRVIKDLWYRFNTLQGKKIEFNGGWDTQGLPVELQVEKELGVTGGKTDAIKQFGVERIVSECKKVVEKFNKTWVEVDELLGMSFNHEKAYWTFRDEFIEREWQILKKAHDNNILEEDFTVIAYCPSCQTSLSHAEVNQGYEEVKDPSLYYKVKLVDEDVFLIVWTTMPFTLVTDAMVGLQPDEDYAYVKVENETWVVGKTRLEDFMLEVKIEEYKIEKTVKGSEFEGKKYIHPLLDLIPELNEFSKSDNYHVAVSESFVDASTGSGLVHLSPANGEEDIKIANKRKVKIFSPINDEVKFTSHAGKYQGMFVRDADRPIVEDLKDCNALVKIGKIKHKYPLCWRSHHPIVWLARRGWFYKLDRLENKAIDAAESVEYFFEQPKNRFLGIIKERHPWCISRERIWGCPLPVWNCEECNEKNWFFTRKEIVGASENLPDGPNFELHRPWIDNITVKCKKCGSTKTKREEYVLDTWHNSGAAPYSSLTDEEYSKEIPAPFFTEGIDQTRGWAYTLLIENVILNNSATPPYKAFLFQGHVLDEKGGKMSKSKGNVLEGAKLLQKYPTDLIRFYFMWKASPIEPLSFSTDELMSRPYQVINTLFNLHLYFKQNSQYDNFESSSTIEWAKQNNLLTSPDIWLLSKLQKLIQTMTEKNQSCKFHESAKAIDDFVINNLSQIYIPITRGELWDEDEEKKNRRLAIYAVLDKVLKTLDILIHPFCPFTSEYLYHTVFEGKQSILLDKWPEYQESLVNEKIEESFDIMKDVVSISSAARMKGKLKRRWPLNEAQICVKKGQKIKLETLSKLLQSQLNVEKFTVIETEQESGLEQISELKQLGLPAKPTIELERKRIGPKAKQHMGKLVSTFSETEPEKIVASLQKEQRYDFEIDDETISLEKEDFIVDFDASENFAMAKRDNYIVFISTSRNQEMMAKGLIKDVARRLQTLRKERGYTPTDILETASILDLDKESLEMIKDKTKDLAFLVRVKEVNFTESCKEYKDDDIDGQKIRISVE
ncbi:MAG TPA: isoleucine--tRNA ligase [Nitrosopumilus sp.]|jgi:isoleucyl-tRNA synthetase|nr:isoleucine--tRNA ligase [Nitrosopumilus sp.]HJL67749.1 isoleucine--tRNA ligase [Nitrosopumilus sp.]HJM25266.1 isoleucine--tRNA ligase [Nitrosopumilus sp.]HJO31495.1 isoleucine--tRNA ligase [Nitrosopumilus sp.]|tara:strand:- start:6595 stop:9792 length:3198 start_codon:yes stop_codon:yes gene_type:complete